MENKIVTPIFDLSNFKYKTNYVIEASAGTGKTYNITEIVRKLLLDYRLGLDKILIVTYTEKAAGELKNRIREILTSPNKELNNLSIKEYLGSEVNTDIDNASIGTIHSFCKKTIDEFAISISKATNMDLVSDNTIIDFANKYIREGKILDDITNLLSFNIEINENILINRLKSVSDAYYLDKNFNEDKSIVSYLPSFDENITSELPFKLYLSNDVVQTLKENDLGQYNNFLILKNADRAESNEFLSLFIDFKSLCIDERSKTKFKITKLNGYTDAEKNAFDALFKLKEYFKSFNPIYYLVDKYLKDFYKSFSIYKEENRLQSFNDMIRDVRESLISKNSELLTLLRNKYSYGIIDEFQDTNQIQFDIFSKMFLCDDHNIIVVGDPKQSIYSFQGADINVYQKASEIISNNGIKCRLAKNYRSAAGVIEFTNKLFEEYDFNFPFEPSSYCLLSNNEKERRVKFNNKYCSSLWINEEKLSEVDFAKFAVEQIINCVSKNESGHTNLELSYIENGNIKYKDVSFNDFAVLARTRNEMDYIEQSLKLAGIPFTRYKDNSLFNGIECAEWISLLEAINVTDFTGKNRGYFKKALFTKFFDLPLSEIAKEVYDSDDVMELDLFNKWKNLAKQRLWQDLFDNILIDTNLNKQLSSLSDLQSLSIYKQLSNYCIDYLSNNKNLTDLIKHLNQVSKFSEDDEEVSDNPSLVAKSTDFNSVHIMTMHASKGLQFPVVICVGGISGKASSQKVYKYHLSNQDGSLQNRVISLIKGEGNADNEQALETNRLFYVAYTRSEYLLIAPRYIKPGLTQIASSMENFLEKNTDSSFVVDNENVPYYEMKEFKDISYHDLRNITESILASAPQIDESSQKEEQLKVLHHLIKIKNDNLVYKHSYSSLAHPLAKQDNEIIDDDLLFDKEGTNESQLCQYDLSAKQVNGIYDSFLSPSEIPSGYPKGSLMGNSIHEVFERLDFMNYENALEKLIVDRFEYNGCSLKDNQEYIDYSSKMVISVMNAVLPIVRGSKTLQGVFKLKDIPLKDKKAEIEFNFNYPNEVLKNYLNGFVDLLFKRGDVYSILDWKSDTLNDDFLSYSDPNELKKHVDERYSIQRVLYSYCLIKYLKQYYNESEEEIFKNHFGGIYYVFVRGCNENTSNGIYIQTWSSYIALEKEFMKIIHNVGK